jgi:hypothetical protein
MRTTKVCLGDFDGRVLGRRAEVRVAYGPLGDLRQVDALARAGGVAAGVLDLQFLGDLRDLVGHVFRRVGVLGCLGHPRAV